VNIFWLDRDPNVAARYNVDAHVSKIQLEIAQMLSTALRRHGVDADIYESTHASHPLVQWCGDSRRHWLATFMHCRALAAEFLYRGFDAPHAGWSMLCDDAWQYREEIPDQGWTDPPLCMPDDAIAEQPEQRVGHDALVDSYRNYYSEYKQGTWTKRDPPAWYG
jgi:hypothetical protein